MIFKKNKIIWLFSLFLLIFSSELLASSFRAGGNDLVVAFLDVEQGDAIFIESPTGVQVLLDAGDGSLVLDNLSKVMPFGDRSIDVLMATHPDKDHIGGFLSVLESYNSSYFLESGLVREETSLQNEIYKKLESKKINKRIVKRGDVIDLGGGAYIEVLFPDREANNFESNSASLGVKLVFGETSFILTGDMPSNIEEYLVFLDGGTLSAEVLKAGHHGSKTSSSPDFVERVSPQYAVISAGANNRYGHPNKEVLETLSNFGAEILKTYESGIIIFQSDGENLRVSYK